ncbi:MAG: response regulator [Actinobacteria bacterium]|nr:response regulator [Actinomycetota bacterium]
MWGYAENSLDELPTTARTGVTFCPMKVLVVVDDEPDVGLIVEMLLSGDPRIEVGGQARDLAEAFSICESEEPGLIVLDNILGPGQTGIQAAPRFKELAPNAKILLYTAHIVSGAVTESAIDAVLNKSDVHLLLPTVQRLLGLEPIDAKENVKEQS